MKKNIILAIVGVVFMLVSCQDPIKAALDDALSFHEQTKTITNDWANAGYPVSNVEVTSGTQYLSASLSSDGNTISFTSKAEGKAKVKFTSSEYKKITKDLTVDVDAQGYPSILLYAADIKWHDDDDGYMSPWTDNPDASAPTTYDGTYVNTVNQMKLKIKGNIVYLLQKNTQATDSGKDPFFRGFYTLNGAGDAISITWKSSGICYYGSGSLRGDTTTQYGELPLTHESISDSVKQQYSDAAWSNRAFSVDASGDITINVGVGSTPADIKFEKK